MKMNIKLSDLRKSLTNTVKVKESGKVTTNKESKAKTVSPEINVIVKMLMKQFMLLINI